MKFIQITMPNREVWEVPAEVVARNRAEYYHEKEGADMEKETEYLLNPDDGDYYDLLDWASNNMDWDDIKHLAKRVGKVPALTDEEKQEGWINGERKVVEHSAEKKVKE